MRIDYCLDLLQAAALPEARLVIPAPRFGWSVLPGVVSGEDVLWSGSRHLSRWAVQRGLFKPHSLGDKTSRWVISAEGRAVLRAFNSELAVLRDCLYETREDAARILRTTPRPAVRQHTVGTRLMQMLAHRRGEWMATDDLMDLLSVSASTLRTEVFKQRRKGVPLETAFMKIRLPAEAEVPEETPGDREDGTCARTVLFGEPFPPAPPRHGLLTCRAIMWRPSPPGPPPRPS